MNSNISTKKPGKGIKDEDEIRNVDLKTLSKGHKNRLIGRVDLVTHPSDDKDFNFTEDGRFGETKNGYAESIWTIKILLKDYIWIEKCIRYNCTYPGVFTTENIADKQNIDFQNDINEIKNKIIKTFGSLFIKII